MAGKVDVREGNSPMFEIADKIAARKAKLSPETPNVAVAEKPAPGKEVETPVAENVDVAAEMNKPIVKQDNNPADVKDENKGQEVKPDAPADKKPGEVEVPKTEKKKQWWEEEESPATIDDKKNKTKPDVDYAAKMQEYEAILKDPEVEALLAAKKAGKNLLSFAEELKGSDTAKLTPEQLFEIKLQRAGATTEEISEELSEFTSLSSAKKKLETQDIKAKLENERQENLKRITNVNSEYAQKQQQVINKATAEAEDFVKDLNDKDFFGVRITPEIASTLKDTVMNGFTIRNPDGTVDVPRSMKLALWDRYEKLVIKANMANAKTEGKEEVLKEITRPSLNNTSDKRLPVDTKDDGKEARKDFISRKA
jgi:ElaB/YqjD/DUF883 family membrane-anchored ribosome-binding protein